MGTNARGNAALHKKSRCWPTQITDKAQAKLPHSHKRKKKKLALVISLPAVPLPPDDSHMNALRADVCRAFLSENIWLTLTPSVHTTDTVWPTSHEVNTTALRGRK